ncbi:hypothetical protein OWR29_29485 [Actinoplanes sp. Pm04-4]|uniref:DUF3800 domain-containing protein n=1 Tax=Paractinoplanes pyxinae TaxID=2997416 RepID=A0ABT4B6L0_9ACTN|nr:hypothetical protein [Actinoplanes pyxinae]MCY1142147.1 hypothetical protein [Actinoplanes pyxinae]
MRTPLQGGLPPVEAVAGPVVEIACDESGFSGTNLLDPATPLITHASVDLTVDEAADLISALRSSSHELKSGPFLRGPRAAEALQLFLTALCGRALVHLVDKKFFLATRIVDLLLAEPSYAAGTRLTQGQRPAALALLRKGSVSVALLAAFADLVRPKRRQPAGQAVDRFVRSWEAVAGAAAGAGPRAGAGAASGSGDGGGLRRGVGPGAASGSGDGAGPRAVAGPGAGSEAGLDGLDPRRVRDLVSRLDDDDRSIPPPLEPLLPALAETILFWNDGGRRRVLVTHDEQSALTADRLARLRDALAVDGVSPLAGLTMVDSRDDPRVQLADLLAGVARRSPESDGLRPLISPTSLLPALW